MNTVLAQYLLDVTDLGATAPEILLMLHRRDAIAEREGMLTAAERRQLRKADETLRAHADELAGVVRELRSPAGTTGWWWELGIPGKRQRTAGG